MHVTYEEATNYCMQFPWMEFTQNGVSNKTKAILLVLKYKTAVLLAVGRKQIIFSPFLGHDHDLGHVLGL